MATPKDTIWAIEPHTLAKHEILRRYLAAWFPILGTYNNRVVYIDGFCGPGRYTGGEAGSPLIALNEASQNQTRLQSNRLVFLFMDERSDRIAHLNQELGTIIIPSNYAVQAITGEFAVEFKRLLDNLDTKGMQLAPTFAFIDPFGFKGLPFELVKRLLKNPKTEVFINVMVDSINRFLEHPDDQIRQHIVELFGTSEALEIANRSNDRTQELRFLYQKQLSQCAKYVRYFEMRNADGRAIYYLFFASNHPLGHVKMKEAFWKVDRSSGFCFSDATNPNQMVLFEIDETPKLALQLQQQFCGRKVVVAELREFTENQTPFLASHMRKALSALETEQSIEVAILKQDGNKRRKGSFPDDVIITFSSS